MLTYLNFSELMFEQILSFEEEPFLLYKKQDGEIKDRIFIFLTEQSCKVTKYCGMMITIQRFFPLNSYLCFEAKSVCQ